MPIDTWHPSPLSVPKLALSCPIDDRHIKHRKNLYTQDVVGIQPAPARETDPQASASRAQLLPLTGRVYEGNPGSEKSGIDRDKSTFKPDALEVVERTAGHLVFGQRDHHRGAVEDRDPVLDSHMPQRERLGPDAHH